jgi:5-formyltetrahydrofolate cyclo-ligase
MIGKKDFRLLMFQRLRSIPTLILQNFSDKIQELAVDSDLFQKASCIASYYPLQGEVFTQFVFETAKNKNKRVGYPRVNERQTLDFYEIDHFSELSLSRWNVWEPSSHLPSERRLLLDQIDLMIIPGLAFDRFGKRLGRGRGCYDQILQHFSGIKMGFAYSLQMVSEIPFDSWDESVDFLVTENEIIHFRG